MVRFRPYTSDKKQTPTREDESVPIRPLTYVAGAVLAIAYAFMGSKVAQHVDPTMGVLSGAALTLITAYAGHRMYARHYEMVHERRSVIIYCLFLLVSSMLTLWLWPYLGSSVERFIYNLLFNANYICFLYVVSARRTQV